VEVLASIIGEEDLSAHDRLFLQFANDFDQSFIQQQPFENRSIFATLDLGWKLAIQFPARMLTRVKPEEIGKYGAKKD
jgi:V/A-type H+-transporting ATPase subunit B